MPDTALPASEVDLASDVDLADLIPAPREADAEVPDVVVAEPEIAPAPETDGTVVSGERLAFLWTLLGAVAGSAIVAVAFLAILTLLP